MITATLNFHKRGMASIFQVIVLAIGISCSTKTAKDEGADNTDSTKAVSQTESAADKDNGGKNVKDYLIDEKTVDPAIKKFISNLNKNDVAKLIDTDRQFVIINPGPGVQPVYTLGQSLEDLLGLSEMLLLLSDSSALTTTIFYDFPKDRCALLEEFPEGIYIKDINFADKMHAWQSTGDDEAVNRKIKAALDPLGSKSGTELLIKFSDKNLNTLFLDAYLIRKDDSLIIAVLDQRNCGA